MGSNHANIDYATTAVPVHTARNTGLFLTIGTVLWLIALALWSDREGLWVGSVLGGIAALVFQLSLLGLLQLQSRTHAMGSGTLARRAYMLEAVVICGAIVSTILDAFWLVHGSVVWAIFDACWPLSMLGMFLIGVRIAIAGRWRGILRWWALFAQAWLIFAIPFAAFGETVQGIAASGQLLLGYAVLGVLIARDARPSAMRR